MKNKASLALLGAFAAGAMLLGSASDAARGNQAANAPPANIFSGETGKIVAMRRLTEAQYRNSIADIFGPTIEVAGRFEPIVRPVHEMIASGARAAAISPAGIEQFDAMARIIAGQVFNEENRGQFVPCAPGDAARADADCARKVLTPLGRYIFRRPLTKSEQDFYVDLAGNASGPTSDFYKGLELALSAMLVSPNFLYIVETAQPDPDRAGEMRLDNFARASRLSFLLWDTTPNENLIRAAEKGQLTDPAKLEAIATSMVASPRFEYGLRAFFADMLLFEKFDEIAKDPVVYPYFNQDIAKALPEQTLRTIVDHLLTRNGDYRDIFTTPYTFMNRPLASAYQVQVKSSQGWEPYKFGESDDRVGILGQAGFLALYSHSGRSSPTLRGRAIRELLMCQPVPDPPGDVNFTAVQDTENKEMPTARIRLTAHRTEPVCAGCHLITDPIGLGLEKFDGIGAFRATENNAEIDITGSLDGVDFTDARGLGQALSKNQAVSQCVSSRALEYATAGSPDGQYALVEGLEQNFAAQGYKIRDLFLRIATMPETYQARTEALEAGQTKVTMAAQ
ncbi:MAG: DUF1592 domain-containing protein [Novosphingobium sp.]|nr:DUF1592 domain-containing protein [Novosphingobium sp.]